VTLSLCVTPTDSPGYFFLQDVKELVNDLPTALTTLQY
jgi:hypothetical protein